MKDLNVEVFPLPQVLAYGCFVEFSTGVNEFGNFSRILEEITIVEKSLDSFLWGRFEEVQDFTKVRMRRGVFLNDWGRRRS